MLPSRTRGEISECGSLLPLCHALTGQRAWNSPQQVAMTESGDESPHSETLLNHLSLCAPATKRTWANRPVVSQEVVMFLP
jgi:hypothetical protein